MIRPKQCVVPWRAAWVVLGAVVASLLGCPAGMWAAADEPLTVEALTARARDSVVIMTHLGRDGEEQGVGAGFILSEDGLIATCLHVIGEARPIQVRLSDGREFAASEVEAWDRKLDLAIIRVEAQGLPALPLGDSDELRQGAGVVAMGNPMGMELSVVQGVLSARREFEEQELLQLAIPIEPGNSGGPLLDMQGRVQGILNMKSALTRNLGFAIPINQLKPLMAEPNRVPMQRWLTIGTLNAREWEPRFGARWTRKGGVIHVEDPGRGFGGRSLCLYQGEVPDRPYEISVTMKMDDESGAAGLVFGADGEDAHYGFYPSAGQMRLTRFEGPSVFTWTILEQFSTPHYRPGDWNTLKVQRDAGKILGYVNGHLVLESADEGLPDGQVGLAKFRQTKAQFKRFHAGPKGSSPILAEDAEWMESMRARLRSERFDSSEEKSLLAKLRVRPEDGRRLLRSEARDLEAEADRLRELERRMHIESVQEALREALAPEEARIDLLQAALLLAKLDNPDLEMAPYQRQLQQMAEDIRDRFGAQTTGKERLDGLLAYLFEENGFHGSRSDYYNQANSYLSQVLDDREGIPITLSVLVLELAQRVGLENVHGVPLPGHFMVAYESEEGSPRLIDVFEGGRTVSRSEAEERVLATSGILLRDAHLEPATKREIILRMLRNLQNIASARESLREELKYQDVILALAPDSAVDRYQRAGLHLRAGNLDEAKADLAWLLEHQPPGLDLERVSEIYRSLDE